MRENALLAPLRVLVLVPKPVGLSPGQRFRLEQWAPHLQVAHGITLDFEPFESPGLTSILYKPGHRFEKAGRVLVDFARRAGAVWKARGYDAAVVYREAALVGPGIYERMLASLDVPLLFDFDDAIWRESEQSTSQNGLFAKLHFWGKTSTTCRLADAVLVGNQYLGDYARQRNKAVFVLPTSIELTKYSVQPEAPDDGRFVVCWTGSYSTLPHFEHARPALEMLAARRRLVVKVICNKPPDRPISGADNLFVPWTEAGEAEAIGASHVGIMPLPDTDYTRGKCGLKALQYMATGRPVVISPVGMNSELIQSGENGFLASDDDEWVSALDALAASPALRAKLGAAGRRTVEERYSATALADLFAKALRTTLERKRD